MNLKEKHILCDSRNVLTCILNLIYKYHAPIQDYDEVLESSHITFGNFGSVILCLKKQNNLTIYIKFFDGTVDGRIIMRDEKITHLKKIIGLSRS